jgi:predicted O-methyltransferase YrrM
LCLASAGGRVDTLEGDATHVEQARTELERAGVSERVRVHEGDFMVTLPRLSPGYDLVFFDGFAPSEALYREIERLLAPRGLVVSANLNHGSGEDYIAKITDRERWQTRFVDAAKETAVSVRRPGQP